MPKVKYGNVEQVLNIITGKLPQIHSRHMYDMFGLYQTNLESDLRFCLEHGIIDENFKATESENYNVLPNFSKQNTNRLNYLWDYFTFVYMSHKIQNIRRQQSLNRMPTLMYLRGSDYEFTLAEKGVGVSTGNLDDSFFQFSQVVRFSKEFNILKALSPSDLKWIMVGIGEFIAIHGNGINTVAEYARINNSGIYLNSNNWKRIITALLPSASVFLVYVSNRSQGLKFELESLLKANLEKHTVLVLSEEPSKSHDDLYDLQNSIDDEDRLLFTIDRAKTRVVNKEEFEDLLERFPHRIKMHDNKDQLHQEVAAKIKLAKRQVKGKESEIPFEFNLPLNNKEKKQIEVFHDLITANIDEVLYKSKTSNLHALLLFLEFDIYLNLLKGGINKAAESMVKYGALADFTAKNLKLNIPQLYQKLGEEIEKHALLGYHVGESALALGAWNDYSNRMNHAKDLLKNISNRVIECLAKSFDNGKKSILPISIKEDRKDEKIEAQTDMMRNILDKISKDSSTDTEGSLD